MAVSKKTLPNTTVDPSVFGETAPERSTRMDGWYAVDPSTIGGFVQASTSCGIAVIFTTAQAGNALGLTILNGQEKIKKYFTDGKEMEDYLAATIIKLIATLPQEVQRRIKEY